MKILPKFLTTPSDQIDRGSAIIMMVAYWILIITALVFLFSLVGYLAGWGGLYGVTALMAFAMFWGALDGSSRVYSDALKQKLQDVDAELYQADLDLHIKERGFS